MVLTGVTDEYSLAFVNILSINHITNTTLQIWLISSKDSHFVAYKMMNMKCWQYEKIALACPWALSCPWLNWSYFSGFEQLLWLMENFKKRVFSSLLLQELPLELTKILKIFINKWGKKLTFCETSLDRVSFALVASAAVGKLTFWRRVFSKMETSELSFEHTINTYYIQKSKAMQGEKKSKI